MDSSQPSGYVRNGDFELETRDWSGGWADLRTVGIGVSGNCLELNGKYGSQQYALGALPRLTPATQYEFSFWVKSGTSGDESFEVGLWDAISMRWVVSQTGRSSSQWTKYSLNYTTDTADRLSVELMKDSPTKGSMLFDSVHLIPRP